MAERCGVEPAEWGGAELRRGTGDTSTINIRKRVLPVSWKFEN